MAFQISTPVSSETFVITINNACCRKTENGMVITLKNAVHQNFIIDNRNDLIIRRIRNQKISDNEYQIVDASDWREISDRTRFVDENGNELNPISLDDF